MSRTTLGIDLSTKNIGVSVIVWKDYETKQVEDVILDAIQLQNRNYDVLTIKELLNFFKTTNQWTYDEIIIEIGNFGNPLMTQKFALLAGMVVCLVPHKNTKYVSPSTWFDRFSDDYKIPNKGSLKRNERKKFSLLLLNDFLIKNKIKTNKRLTDDMSDAFWIAFYGNKCPSYFATKKHKIKEGNLKCKKKKTY